MYKNTSSHTVTYGVVKKMTNLSLSWLEKPTVRQKNEPDRYRIGKLWSMGRSIIGGSIWWDF